MSDLKNRIERLEGSLGEQATIREPFYIDDLIRKLGLDPEKVRATAQADKHPLSEIIAGELGLSNQEFLKALKEGGEG